MVLKKIEFIGPQMNSRAAQYKSLIGNFSIFIPVSTIYPSEGQD